MSKKLSYGLLALLLLLCASLALRLIPFSHAEGDFWNSTREIMQLGHVSSTFLPTFYPFLCAHVYRLAGPFGVSVMQAMMYFGMGAIVLATIRKQSGVEGVPAAAAAGLIMVDPDLLSSIPKLWDTEMTVLCVSGLLGVFLLLRSKQGWTLWIAGLVWGISLAVRPNLLLMILPLGYALWLAYGRRALLPGVFVIAVALAVLAAANTAGHDSFYLPQNGPYNLFAGANPHTQAALAKALNAEPSIPPAMADHGYPAVNSYALELRPVYTKFAVAYIVAHPFGWLWLGVLKLATLLRPDTKAHPLGTPAGLLKLLTSLSTVVWVAALIWAKRMQSNDKLVLLFAFAYVLPFILTNADPRFRPALDVMLLTHAASLVLWKIHTREKARSAIHANPGLENVPA